MNSPAIKQPDLPAAANDALLGRVRAVTRGPLTATAETAANQGVNIAV